MVARLSHPVSVLLLWLASVVAVAAVIVAAGFHPEGTSISSVAGLLAIGGVVAALVALFVGYFDDRFGRLF